MILIFLMNQSFQKVSKEVLDFMKPPVAALSHWIVIKDGKIKNYQCVVPSTWNAGPRNQDDAPGPYEASLGWKSCGRRETAS